MKKDTTYLKKDRNNQKFRRIELWIAPLLILTPFLVSTFLIHNWYSRGYSTGSSLYNGELFIAIIILFGNIVFDIPFIKSLKIIEKK